MLNKSLSGFIQDERGSYTMWSVAWFMIYVGIGGLAVDATDVYRHETLLQATGDASSMAGVMSLPNQTEAVDQALAYAQDNMQRTSHGTVLAETDVKVGTWDFDERTFYSGATANPNAVYVTTRREEANGNPLGMNMLRFLSLAGGGDLWWNVHAEAVAVRYIPECAREGFIAKGDVSWTNSNDFYNNICLHAQLGEMGIPGAVQGNTYQTGVTISRGQVDGLNFNSKALTDDSGLGQAVEAGGVTELWPAEATRVTEYISVLKNLDDIGYTALTEDDGTHKKYESWSFMFDGANNFAGPSVETELPSDEVFKSYTVYDLSGCGGPINLGGYTFEANVVLVTSCAITAPAGADLSAGNIVIASDYVTSGQNSAIKLAAQSKLGNPSFCNNDDGNGGVQFYALGNVSLAAQTDWHGVRVAAGGNVDLAAHNDVYGVSVQAGGNIDVQTHGDYGLCPNIKENGPFEWRYRLMQ